MMPKAAFQFGVKMSDGRKAHNKLGKQVEQKEQQQLKKIRSMFNENHGEKYKKAFEDDESMQGNGGGKSNPKRRRIWCLHSASNLVCHLMLFYTSCERCQDLHLGICVRLSAAMQVDNSWCQRAANANMSACALFLWLMRGQRWASRETSRALILQDAVYCAPWCKLHTKKLQS